MPRTIRGRGRNRWRTLLSLKIVAAAESGVEYLDDEETNPLMTLAGLTAHLADGGEATCRCSYLTTRYEPGLGDGWMFETVVYDYGARKDSSPYVFVTAEEAAREAIVHTNFDWHWGECDGNLAAQ